MAIILDACLFSIKWKRVPVCDASIYIQQGIWFLFSGENASCVLMQCWNRYDFKLLKTNDETQISEYYYGESAKRLETMKPE